MNESKQQLSKDVAVLNSRLQAEVEEKQRIEKRCEELVAITKDIVPKMREYEDTIAGLNKEKEELLTQTKQGTFHENLSYFNSKPKIYYASFRN